MLSGLFVVLFASAAHAQYVPGEPGIIVNPSTVEVGGTIEVQGQGCPRNSTVTIYVGDILVATTTPPAAQLPVTGSDTGMYVKGALALIAAGGLLVLATRRRRATV
jgi:LPXTG-motif cell wall-anchored protein